jgi:hypothetical protein
VILLVVHLLAFSLFGWLVADGWCWFVLREEYCWLVAGGWFVLREKYCWLVRSERKVLLAGGCFMHDARKRYVLLLFHA